MKINDKMKSGINTVYKIAKAVAVVIVLIAALGVIYSLYIDEGIRPMGSSYSSLEGGIVATNDIQPFTSKGDVSVDSVMSEASDDSKIAYSAALSLRTQAFDSAISQSKDIIKKYDIEILSEDYRIYSGERSDRFYLKVRSDEFDSAIDELENLGNVVSFTQDGDNITKQYTDVERRVQSLESQLQRFYALLDSSTSTSDLSNIYSQIDYIESQLEYARRNMENLDNAVQYSTISVIITDTHRYDPDGKIVDTDSFLGDFIYSLGDSWVGFFNFVLGAIIALVYILPYAIFIALVCFIVRFIRRRRKDSKKDSSDKDDDDNKRQPCVM